MGWGQNAGGRMGAEQRGIKWGNGTTIIAESIKYTSKTNVTHLPNPPYPTFNFPFIYVRIHYVIYLFIILIAYCLSSDSNISSPVH